MRIGDIDARGQAVFDDALNTAGTPAISFDGDTDTGITRVGADEIGFATGGTFRFNITTSGAVFTVPLTAPDGTAGAPAYTFTSDPDTGIYSAGANEIGVAAGGSNILTVTATGLTIAAALDIVVSGGGELTGLPAIPSGATAAASKSYVDSISAGLDPKQSVRVATTGALPAVTAAGSGAGKTLTADAVGVVTVDGEDLTAANSFAVGDRVLIKDQAQEIDNGIYTITILSAAGVALELTRATDFDGTPSNEVSGGNFTYVEGGASNINAGFVVTNDGDVVVDTDDIIFTQFTGAGSFTAGVGLAQSGSTIFFDPDDLSDTAIVAADELTFHDVSYVDTGTDKGARKRTVSSFLSDLDIVNTLGGNGIAVQTAADTYTARTIVVSGAGAGDGLTIADGDGVAGNPTIGLDITGNVAAGEDAAAADLFIAYNDSASANETFTLTEVANGISTILSFDASRITDADSDTFVETDTSDDDTIRMSVGAGGPGPEALTNLITIDNSLIKIGGVGVAAVGAGHDTSLLAGDGGVVTGDGGAITITAGDAPTTASGGDVSITAGSSTNGGDGGSVTITAGGGSQTVSGSVDISTPDTLAGADVGSGAITITTGDVVGAASSGDGGSITIATGDGRGTSFSGGAINLTAGNGSSNANGAGGTVTITAGNNGSDGTSDAGDLVLVAGASSGAGDGGNIDLTPGDSASGTLGSININPVGTGAGETAELRFFELASNGTDYAGFKAPDAVSTAYTLALPAADAAGALTSDGAGNLSFVAAAAADTITDSDGDTLIQVEESADEDIIRFDVGETPTGYGSVPNVMTLAASGLTVALGTANVATTAGAPISFTAGTGNTTGGGGAITLTGGDAGGSVGPAGGAVNLVGGDGGTSAGGGGVNITGGTGGASNNGGGIDINGGAPGSGTVTGAPITLTAGIGSGAGVGGLVEINGAVGGATGAGGAVTLNGGDGGGTSGDGGDLNLNGGAADGAGAGGDVNLTAGLAVGTNVGGVINITGGAGGTGAGGDGGAVVITAGSAGAASAGDGGDIELRPGALDGAGADGTVRIIGPTSGVAGEIRLEDNTGGQYIGLEAAGTISSSFTLTLPDSDSTGTQALVSDGAGTLSWSDISAVSFGTIAADSGTNPVADAENDTLTLAGATNGGIATVGDSGTDTVTFLMDIDDLTALGAAPDVADLIAISDDTDNVTKSVTITQLASAIQGATSLDDLSDVDLTAEAAGFALVYDSVSGNWEAKKIYHTETFGSSTQWVVTHDLNTQYVVVTVYNGSDVVVIPSAITATSSTVTTIDFAVATAGDVAIMGVEVV